MGQDASNQEADGSTAPRNTTARRMHRYASSRPAEVEAAPVDEGEYKKFRTATDLREPYKIPSELLQNTKKFSAPDLFEAPLLIFINSRSGGRAGARLTDVLYRAVGHAQVFDLQECRPDVVLKQLWENFRTAIAAGDKRAAIVQRRLRILAAGGDGTVAWVLKTVADLDLVPEPAVAILPLGTGNDLSLSFGWGNTFLQRWISNHVSIYDMLKRIAEAQPRALDTWSLSITAGSEDLFSDLPHSLQLVDPGRPGSTEVKGRFWNYFSLGMDARAAYGFHQMREKSPWLASGRGVNQFWYAYYGCRSGWFCCAPPLRNRIRLQARNAKGEMVPVPIPASVNALVLLNLQSYGGGRDLWGLKHVAEGWHTPIFNDGLLEAVGLRSGWHTALVMGGVAKKIHGVRLAQSSDILISIKAEGGNGREVGTSFMQLDGEPWQQDVPSGDSELQVHVKHQGTARLLMNTQRLAGMARKINSLARREALVSRPKAEDAAGTDTMGAAKQSHAAGEGARPAQGEVAMTHQAGGQQLQTRRAVPIAEHVAEARGLAGDTHDVSTAEGGGIRPEHESDLRQELSPVEGGQDEAADGPDEAGEGEGAAGFAAMPAAPAPGVLEAHGNETPVIGDGQGHAASEQGPPRPGLEDAGLP